MIPMQTLIERLLKWVQCIGRAEGNHLLVSIKRLLLFNYTSDFSVALLSTINCKISMQRVCVWGRIMHYTVYRNAAVQYNQIWQHTFLWSSSNRSAHEPVVCTVQSNLKCSLASWHLKIEDVASVSFSSHPSPAVISRESSSRPGRDKGLLTPHAPGQLAERGPGPCVTEGLNRPLASVHVTLLFLYWFEARILKVELEIKLDIS